MNPSQSILKCGQCNHRQEKKGKLWCDFHKQQLQSWKDGARVLDTVETQRINGCSEINLFNYKILAFIEKLKGRTKDE